MWQNMSDFLVRALCTVIGVPEQACHSLVLRSILSAISEKCVNLDFKTKSFLLRGFPPEYPPPSGDPLSECPWCWSRPLWRNRWCLEAWRSRWCRRCRRAVRCQSGGGEKKEDFWDKKEIFVVISYRWRSRTPTSRPGRLQTHHSLSRFSWVSKLTQLNNCWIMIDLVVPGRGHARPLAIKLHKLLRSTFWSLRSKRLLREISFHPPPLHMVAQEYIM